MVGSWCCAVAIGLLRSGVVWVVDMLRKSVKRKEDADGKSSMAKIVKDLKLIIDQLRIDDTRGSKRESKEYGDDPLKRFFTDEVTTTRRLLRLVRSGLDSVRSADDFKVSVITFYGTRNFRMVKEIEKFFTDTSQMGIPMAIRTEENNAIRKPTNIEVSVANVAPRATEQS